MTEPAVRLLSYAEYLAVDRGSPLKHEYIDGIVYAMGGGTVTHSLLGAAVGAELRAALEGTGCRVHSADQRIRIPGSGRAFYPDATVSCGPIVRDEHDPDALADATILVEVLSPSTEKHDRGLKLAEYRTLPSVQAVLFVHCDHPVVHKWGPGPNGQWGMTVHGPGRSVPLPHDKWLPIDAIYNGIALEPQTRRPIA